MTRFAILSLAALTACTGDKGTDSGDSGPGVCGDQGGMFAGPTTVQYASVACDANNNVRFYVETEGLTSDGVAFAQETANDPTGQWSDSITLESYEWDECGYWDHLEHELATGSDLAGYQQNVNTVFTCAAHFDPGNAVMTYAVGVYDLDGNLADCLAWGDDVAGMIANTAGTRINEPDWDLSSCEEGVPAR